MTPQGDQRGFRLLLLLGAALTLGTGAVTLWSPATLRSALGLVVGAGEPGFEALARIYALVVLAVGVGYLLAAADPLRQRGLLVVLFLVPLGDLVGNVVGMASGGVGAGRGVVFAVIDFAYCLLFFRLYPRAGAGAPSAPAGPEPGPASSDTR